MTVKTSCIAVLILGLVGVGPLAWSWADSVADLEITIKVSPHVLNLGIEEGSWVTVHTDIGFDEVDRESVTLNDIAISWSKADDRGNFVAKFKIAEVKDAVKPGMVELTLAGYSTDGDSFTGSETIKVVANPRK